MGRAVSRNTKSVGRGTVAGCKRSQLMSKTYTNRSVDKLRGRFIVFLPERNTMYENTPRRRAEARNNYRFMGGTMVFQHVDVLTQIMWSKDEGDLADRSYNSVRMWAQDVRMALHMQCNDKNVIIPERGASKHCAESIDGRGGESQHHEPWC